MADVVEILTKNNEALLKQVKSLSAQITELTEQLARANQHSHYLEELLKEFQRKLFGRSKETAPEDSFGQISLFDEAVPTIELIEETEITAHKRKKKGNKAKVLAQFPARYTDHELSEEEQVCDCCGDKLIKLGVSEVREEVEFIQATLEKIIHRQHSYVCKSCEHNDVTSIKKAIVPKPLISNSFGSASVVTETIRQKYQQKVPAYRQEKFWHSLNLPISRDNICNWHILTSQQVLEPVYMALKKKLNKQEVIHADETSYTVIQSKRTKTYYWLYCSADCEEKQIVLYEHAESRGHEIPKEFLKDFSGYIHCDGWGAYPKLPNMTIVACGVHMRRKFFEALEKKQVANPTAPANIALQYWKKMFKVEAKLKDISFEERLKQRQLNLKPILDDFFNWCETLNCLSKSKLGKAVNYATKHKRDIYQILKDGRVELSNNKAERMIKELVIGRKNWMFSTSLAGATASGVILSIIKTAELNGLNIQKYLNYLLTEIPNLKNFSEEKIQNFLPWTDQVQSICR